MTVDPYTESPSTLKVRIQKLTGVPVARQKLLTKTTKQGGGGGGGWKGMLKDNTETFASLSLFMSSEEEQDNKINTITNKEIVVTLIGSAEVLSTASQTAAPVKFVEDMTAEEIQQEATKRLFASSTPVIGMIPAIQKQYPMERNDNKTEWYTYNHYVSGLPQRQIEDLLVSQQPKQPHTNSSNESRSNNQNDNNKMEVDGTTGPHEDNNTDDSMLSKTTSATLVGRVVMSMGMELRRSLCE